VSDDLVLASDATFAGEVLGAATPVVVDFWADWCGPCHMMAPVFAKLAGEFRGRLKFAKLDVDANPATADAYGIRGIPTLIVFRDGEEADRIVGYLPEAHLRMALERHLQPV